MFNPPINFTRLFAKRIKLFIHALSLFSAPSPASTVLVSVFFFFFIRWVFYDWTYWKVQNVRVFRDSRLFLYDTLPRILFGIWIGISFTQQFWRCPGVHVDIDIPKDRKWVAVEFLWLCRTLDWIQRHDFEKQLLSDFSRSCTLQDCVICKSDLSSSNSAMTQLHWFTNCKIEIHSISK